MSMRAGRRAFALLVLVGGLLGCASRPAATPLPDERPAASTDRSPEPEAPPAPENDTATTASIRAGQDPFLGRWNITIRTAEGERPSWLEIRRSGFRTLVGQFVGVVGSARPVAEVTVRDGEMRLAIPPQWEEGAGELSLEGRRQGEGLAGFMHFPDGQRFPWTAVRAPSLHRTTAPEWGEPITLFNGRNLDGWRTLGGESRWSVANGVLRNAGSGANLVTDRRFDDFKLRVEFRYPRGSNSGIYLRGRYEVQIADPAAVLPDPPEYLLGAVYGFLPPVGTPSRDPERWQVFEITLVGRLVTVTLDGTTIICEREIPGITGGALDGDEGAPGPILLQGDHGPAEFRSIVLTPGR